MTVGAAPNAHGQLELSTAALAVRLDPAAGSEITFVGPPGGANALAHYEWAAPRPASSSVTYGSSQADWLSRYRGGWQELIPNTGAACEVDGVSMAFHGDASLAAWEVLAADPAACLLRCATRLPLVVERRMTVDPERPVLRIEETVRNESELEVRFLWGHHPVFPAAPGARIDLPDCSVESEAAIGDELAAGAGVWPHLPASAGDAAIDLSLVPDRPLERVLYASELAAAWAAVRQPEGGAPSVAMSWDPAAFGCVWIWLQRHVAAFPHFGRAEMLGIEPHAAYPFDGLAAARERGRALCLGPGATRTAWLTMTLFEGGEWPVRGVGRDGEIELGEAG